MGDIEARDAQILLDAADFRTHVQTQLCVQIGKRLVHQQNLGPQHQHARERHALLFAARELIGIALLGVPQADHRQTFAHLRSERVSRQPANTQTVGNVLKNRHVREKRIVLKDKSHVALIGRHLSNVGAVHNDLPRRRYFKPGDHSERGGLAAARRAEKRKELSGADRQVHVVDRQKGFVVFDIRAADAAQFE